MEGRTIVASQNHDSYLHDYYNYRNLSAFYKPNDKLAWETWIYQDSTFLGINYGLFSLGSYKEMLQALRNSCKDGCSEKVHELQDMGHPVEGGLNVAFDPLVGSKIVSSNFMLVTIFSIWQVDKFTGVTVRNQVVEAMSIYSPTISYVIALKDTPGMHKFLLLDGGLIVLSPRNSSALKMKEIGFCIFTGLLLVERIHSVFLEAETQITGH